MTTSGPRGWQQRRREAMRTGFALVAVASLPLACSGACADLVERARGLLDDDDDAIEAQAPAPAAPANDAGAPVPRELQAAPAVRQIALQCRLAVALPLRASMESYVASVERTNLTDGRNLAIPPELAVEIETCHNGARDVRELPCDAELHAAWQAFLDAMTAVEPVLREVSTYYRGLRYMDDGMQQAAPLHQRLTSGSATLDSADRRLGELLWRAHSVALRERRDRLRGDEALRVHWLTAQTLLAAVELLRGVQQPGRTDPKKRLAQLAGWRAGLDRYAADNPLELPARLPGAALAPRLLSAAARVEHAGVQVIGDGSTRNGRGRAIDQLEMAVLELALVDGELR